MASLDLNDDGAPDLVLAETLADGTRLHAFVALPGDRVAPQAPAVQNGGQAESGHP